MIRLSRLTDYGILLMTLVARDSEQKPKAARDLADEASLPLPTVSKVLKILLAHNLLISHRGAKGGYLLAHAADEISVAAIIEAMEGPIGLTECSANTGNCDLLSYCPMRSNWAVISTALRDALQRVKVADLLTPVHLASKSGQIVSLRMPTGRMQ